MALTNFPTSVSTSGVIANRDFAKDLSDQSSNQAKAFRRVVDTGLDIYNDYLNNQQSDAIEADVTARKAKEDKISGLQAELAQLEKELEKVQATDPSAFSFNFRKEFD